MTVASIESAKLEKTWQTDARRKFLQYRHAVNDNPHNHQYRELMHAYHQLGMGRTVISLNKAMQLAGTKIDGRPTLAIANASAKWVWFQHTGGWRSDVYGNNEYQVAAFVSDWSSDPRWIPGYGYRDTKHSAFRFPREWFRVVMSNPIRAQVPLVPPEMLPKAHLTNYAILWEADWQNAPRDPYLVRRITADLFVVLAQWELTEVERTVLEMATVSQYGLRV